MANVIYCPDCEKPNAVTFGDGGCLARCPELAFRTDVRCKNDTIALLRARVAELESQNATLLLLLNDDELRGPM